MKNKVNIIVFGHTHIPFSIKKKNGYIINPGSGGQPRNGNPNASYAVVKIEDDYIDIKMKNIIFPNVKLLQTYGLIELGVMRSKSEKDDSLWVKVCGDGYTTRIIEGILQIKADSAMLGYLNATSPFTKDGYFITGDKVLQKGEYIKILGRESEIINVGGQKVYPQEVENIIQEIDNVAEVTVYGEKNMITGNIVCANIRLISDEDNMLFISRLKKSCRRLLQSFQVPVKVKIVAKEQYSERYKKSRIKHD